MGIVKSELAKGLNLERIIIIIIIIIIIVIIQFNSCLLIRRFNSQKANNRHSTKYRHKLTNGTKQDTNETDN